MAILPKAVTKFSATPIKFSTQLFPDIENIILNFILKPPQKNMDNESTAECITIFNLKLDRK